MITSAQLEPHPTQTLELAPGPLLPAAGAVEAASATRARSAGHAGSGLRTPLPAYGAFAVGAAAIVTGAVTGVLTMSAASTYRNECREGVCTNEGLDAASTGRTMSVISPIAFVAGGLGILAGVALVLRARVSARSPSVALGPLLDPRVAGAFATTVF